MASLILLSSFNVIFILPDEIHSTLRKPFVMAYMGRNFYPLSCVTFGVGCSCGQTCESQKLYLWTNLSNIHGLHRWPLPPESPSQLYFSTHVLEEKSSTTFNKLPVKLLLGILHQIPLPSYLSLSATCKSLRSLLTAPDFLDCIIKVAIGSGHLRWILPVDAMHGEVDHAHETFSQWTSAYSA